MYHIKYDKRSQASAAALVAGMQECLKRKPLKNVTVTDLHNATGVSRATFYRLFDTPEDVLLYQMDQMTAQIHAHYEEQCETAPETLLEEVVSVSMYHHSFIRALMDNGRIDMLYQSTEKSFRLLDARNSVFPKNLTDKERDYLISFLSMTIVASLFTWDRNGQTDSPADIVYFLKLYLKIHSDLLRHSE